MQIEEKKLVGVEKTYHFKISIEKDEYFFVVQTFFIDGKEFVMTIKRGVTFWDCQKRLKTSQKKQIKRMIELMF
jgi:uncharacterized Zn finger protein